MASPRMKRKLRNEAPVTVTVVHGHVRHEGERHGPGSTLPMPTWQAEGLVKQGLIRFGATASLAPNPSPNSSEESGQPPAGKGGPSASTSEGSQGDDGGTPPATEADAKKAVGQKTATKKTATKKAAPKRGRRKKAAPKKVTTKVGTTADGKVTG